jgi:hypothetical protein
LARLALAQLLARLAPGRLALARLPEAARQRAPGAEPAEGAVPADQRAGGGSAARAAMASLIS